MKKMFTRFFCLVAISGSLAADATKLVPKHAQGVRLEATTGLYKATVEILSPANAQQHFDNHHWKSLVATNLVALLGKLLTGSPAAPQESIFFTKLKEFVVMHRTYAPVKISITNTSDQPLKLPQSYLTNAHDEPLKAQSVRQLLPWMVEHFIRFPLLLLATYLAIEGILSSTFFFGDRFLVPDSTVAALYVGGLALNMYPLYSLIRKTIRQRAIEAAPQLFNTKFLKRTPLTTTSQHDYIIPPHSTFTHCLYYQRKNLQNRLKLVELTPLSSAKSPLASAI